MEKTIIRGEFSLFLLDLSGQSIPLADAWVECGIQTATGDSAFGRTLSVKRDRDAIALIRFEATNVSRSDTLGWVTVRKAKVGSMKCGVRWVWQRDFDLNWEARNLCPRTILMEK